MREFILRCSKAVTAPFNPTQLERTGKIDTLCRSIIAAFFLADHLRNDVVLHAFLDGPPVPPKHLTFTSELQVGPQERKIAEKISNTLNLGRYLKQGESQEVEPGLSIAKESFESFLKSKKNLYELHPKGALLSTVDLPQDLCIILGDYRGIPKNTEKLLKRCHAERISLGPIMYLASHCITILQHELDQKKTTVQR